MPRRGSRAEQYLAIAAFYGGALVEDLHDPRIPDFVIVHGARRAAHYALAGLAISEKQRRARVRPLPRDAAARNLTFQPCNPA